MGLFDFLKQLFFGQPAHAPQKRKRRVRPKRKPRPPVKLWGYRRRKQQFPHSELVPGPQPPYAFAKFSDRTGHYLDLRQGGDDARLEALGFPIFHTPAEIAAWLDIPVGRLAWLIHRFQDKQRPESTQQSHYTSHWKEKRTGGWRLIESPKPILKSIQYRILDEILNRAPIHHAAHGFVPGRSIRSNAAPHVGQRIVLKFDLENFYATVSFPRVVAIFRSFGYCREAAIWLARLTTSQIPKNIPFPGGNPQAIRPFLSRHLPQGAPTSPALANLSAYGLDLRLRGLARKFNVNYTRYADDLTFSGDERFARSLPTFIPLVEQIVQAERFQVHRHKRRVLRSNQQQRVTGIVVNEKLNVSRADFDRLKATLHNCVRLGPENQNRDNHDSFAAHLRGRIAHVASIHPKRGEKLMRIYEQIRWS